MRELEHRYGPRVHVFDDPVLSTWLARLCSPVCAQPEVNELISKIYSALLREVVSRELPKKDVEIPTRMAAAHPREGVFRGQTLDRDAPVVSVNLARAGTLPSHICYTELTWLLDPSVVRQDHISISRTTDSRAQVIGSQAAGVKIGGPVDGKTIFIPDPMAATGSTLCEIVDLYKEQARLQPNSAQNVPSRFIALHCIVTPEYLKNTLPRHPDLVVYAVRLDRGLSAQEVLSTAPGTHWDRERGLNEHQYIVPGGGGFGEIMNNADY